MMPKDKNLAGIIIELKSLKSDSGKEIKLSQLQKAANQALKQIDDLQYFTELKQIDVKNIIKVGIAFNSKLLAVSYGE